MVIAHLLAQTTQDGVSMETFGWGMAVVGVAGLLGMVLWIVAVLRQTGRTTGTVIGYAAVTDSDGTGTSLARVAEYTVDDTRYECQDTSSSSPRRGDVGDVVQIRYRPSRPAKANLSSPGRSVARIVAWVVLCPVFVGVIAIGVAMITEASESALG
ncbi:DUF3592 domain-containing protein [Actinospongicola halichondriae]|uniref:DUF3592 domain-containing protein n=1 Tax=Actinospongicola halichondriae TaxID=3236844 RepID=UPI003D58B682